MLEQRIIELLTRKLANEASEEELQELNELLTSYPTDLSNADKMQEIWQAPVETEDVSNFFDRHMNKYGHQINPSTVIDDEELDFRRTRRNRSLILAISILVLVGTGMALYLTRSNREAPLFTQIIAEKGVRRSITLPDGTHVWLNGDSKLSYDNRMTDNDTRSVNLIGEAFFDVAHDANHPFVISTKKISLKVLGTSLNVRDYPGDMKSETTLIRGSVELTVNDESGQKLVLKPSEKIAIVDSSVTGNNDSKNHTTVVLEHITPMKIENKEYVAETSWKENKLLFDNETMEEISKKLERWYNKKISITNSAVAEFRFSGAFSDQTIDQALNALQMIKSFGVKTTGDEIIIF